MVTVIRERLESYRLGTPIDVVMDLGVPIRTRVRPCAPALMDMASGTVQTCLSLLCRVVAQQTLLVVGTAMTMQNPSPADTHLALVTHFAL